MACLCRAYHSRTPETLPRFKRWFTGRHSNHRIQRSASMRVHSSTKSHTINSSVRSFATQSFSEAHKTKDRVIHDRPNMTSVTTKRFVSTTSLVSHYLSHVFANRSISVSGPPTANGRLLHETGQTLDEPPYW